MKRNVVVYDVQTSHRCLVHRAASLSPPASLSTASTPRAPNTSCSTNENTDTPNDIVAHATRNMQPSHNEPCDHVESNHCVVHLPASLSPVGSQQRPTGYGSSSDVTTDTSNAIDIASVVSETKLSGQRKYNVILNRKPHPQFNLPSKEYKDSRRQSGTMKRYCQHKWFGIFPFIAYSTQEDGIYCLFCSVFPVKPMQGSRAKMMINKPYSN